MGLNIVVGQAGLLDLGYVAFYAVGAYTTAMFTTSGGLSGWAALPLAILFAAFAGVVLGAPTLRLRGDYLAIVTFGFGEIAHTVARNSASLGEARGIANIPHPAGGFRLSPLPYYELTLAAIVLTVLVIVRLTRSRVGRAWAAIREDEDAAEAMGVPAFKMKLWAFAVGAAIGGLGGWLYASRVSFINPDNFLFFLSLIILSAVVMGGMGSITGVIAGAFAIAFIPEYLREAAAGETLTRWLNTLIGGNAGDITEYRVLLFGVALVLVVVFRPQGLLPSRRRAAELGAAVIAPDEELPALTAVEAAPAEEDLDLQPGRPAGRRAGAGAGRPAGGVRRRRRPRRPGPHRGPGRDRRRHRAQRRRQDHLLQRRHRRVPPGGRRRAPGGAQARRAATRTSAPSPAWPGRSRTSGCSRR